MTTLVDVLRKHGYDGMADAIVKAATVDLDERDVKGVVDIINQDDDHYLDPYVLLEVGDGYASVEDVNRENVVPVFYSVRYYDDD